jgi:hypothetical protein
MKTIYRLMLSFSLVCLGSVFPVAAFAGDDWLPLHPADLALKAPLVDKDADAEAILWEVRLSDEVESGKPSTVLRHYVRGLSCRDVNRFI